MTEMSQKNVLIYVEKRKRMEDIVVGIADMKVAKGDQVLVTYALGSCVGICIYDEVMAVGGMLHAMLPDSKRVEMVTNPDRYVDTGLKKLINCLCKAGAAKNRLKAKMVGGAKMFEYHTSTWEPDIGTQNVMAARRILQSMGMPVLAEVTGGEIGRTIKFNPARGDVLIHTAKRKIQVI